MGYALPIDPQTQTPTLLNLPMHPQITKPKVLSQVLVRNTLRARPQSVPVQQPPGQKVPVQRQQQQQASAVPSLVTALVHGSALELTEEIPFLLQYILSDLLPFSSNGFVLDLSASTSQAVVTALAGLQLLPLLNGSVAAFQPLQQQGAGLGLYLPANDSETFLLQSCGETLANMTDQFRIPLRCNDMMMRTTCLRGNL